MEKMIKNYSQFISDKKVFEDEPTPNEFSGYSKSGEFSVLTKMMLTWCGFTPSKQDPQIYQLKEGTVNRPMDFRRSESASNNLFTNITPTENGTKVIFEIIASGKMIKGLMRGANRKFFKGKAAKQLANLLDNLRKSSEYKHESLAGESNIYGYVLPLSEFIRIMPMWANFMEKIGYAPKSKSESEEDNYFGKDIAPNILGIMKGAKLNRLEMIFPGSWDEYTYLQWAKEGLGLLSPIFSSIDSASSYLKFLDGYKFREVIVGSHGSRSKNYADLIGSIQDDSQKPAVTNFLSQLSKLVDSDSSVYFTSCTAGDNKDRLVDIAKLLNCSVYGAEGVNYLGFASSKGKFWVAKPDGTFEYLGKEPPFVLSFSNELIPAIGKSLDWAGLEKTANEVAKQWSVFKKEANQFVEKCSSKIDDAVKSAGDAYQKSKDFMENLWNSW